MACLLWVAFGYQRDIVRRDFLVPIEYKNLPKDWQIDEPQVTEAKVILQGPEQAFRLLNERSLKISLDLSVIDKKREYSLTKDMINTPSNLTVADIIPRKINVYASKLTPWTFPVHVSTRNALPEGVALQKIIVNPSRIRVLMSSKANPENIRIETEPIDLSKIFFSTILDTKIMLPAGVNFPGKDVPTAKVVIKLKQQRPN